MTNGKRTAGVGRPYTGQSTGIADHTPSVEALMKAPAESADNQAITDPVSTDA